MENNSNTTNNVNTEFTTTTTNAVEITPATDQQVLLSELAKLQGELATTRAELEQYKSSLQIQRDVQSELRDAMEQSAYLLLSQLDSDIVADVIYKMSNVKQQNIVRCLTNISANNVKIGVDDSLNKEIFETEIEDLDDYIADAYDEGQIADLIDNKYSWSSLLKIAFRRGVIDNSDVVDYLDVADIVDDELRSGNISFSDMMSHFDASDCYDWLSDEGRLGWYDVKDYVDMDEVKSDIEIDTDMISDYISNLDDMAFRTLITNLS